MKSLNHDAFNNIHKSKNGKATFAIADGYSVRAYVSTQHYEHTDIYMTNKIYVEDTNSQYANYTMIKRMNLTLSRSNDEHATNYTYYSIDYDKSGFMNTNFMNEMLVACKCKDIPSTFVSFTYLFTCPNTHDFYTSTLKDYRALLNTTVSFAKIRETDYTAYVVDYATNEINYLLPEYEVMTIEQIEKMIPDFPNNTNSISTNNNHGYLRKDKSLKY